MLDVQYTSNTFYNTSRDLQGGRPLNGNINPDCRSSRLTLLVIHMDAGKSASPNHHWHETVKQSIAVLIRYVHQGKGYNSNWLQIQHEGDSAPHIGIATRLSLVLQAIYWYMCLSWQSHPNVEWLETHFGCRQSLPTWEHCLEQGSGHRGTQAAAPQQ